MYTKKRYEAEISVPEYFDQYVDIPTFIKCCQACPSYNRLWSCPSYDFDVEHYWKQYKNLYLLGYQLIFDEESRNRTFEKKELDSLIFKIMKEEKQIISDELLEMEQKNPGSRSLSAGSCLICGKDNCTRIKEEPCRFPDRMRYSIEALGGNVGKTISDLFGIQLEWMEEGRLPAHFVLVCGLLLP